MELQQALLAAGEALLIGFLIGAQREASREETEQQPGVRDFALISLVGALCAFIGSDWIAVAALIALASLLAVYRYQTVGRSGITTEMAAVATFFLGYAAATTRIPSATLLAVSLTIAVLFLLSAKAVLHQLVRKTITETEFQDTIRFLALVFVIYPVLPVQPLGPYGFFDARKVWLFVILVCSISYFGYFLRKFAGDRIGTRLAGVLGGIASSTAATAAFARMSRTDEEVRGEGSAIIANALQFPRVLILLYLLNVELAQACQWVLLAMTAAGAATAMVYWRDEGTAVHAGPIMSNPFSLAPALKFGLLLTVILFVSRAALHSFGRGSVQWIGAIAGLADADAVLLPVAELFGQGAISIAAASGAVLLALAANAVMKSIIASTGGSRPFARRLLASFAGMFVAGTAAWIVQAILV
jgi:uncharacterized membrane protein (DUF4010 family)